MNFSDVYYIFLGFYGDYPYLFPFIFFLSFFILNILFIPVSAFFLILSGFLFPKPMAVFLCSMTTSLSALCSVYLVRKTLGKRKWDKSTLLKKHPKIENLFTKYNNNIIPILIFLRLNPLFPYPIVNILMGLSEISLLAFYIITQLCLLPIIIFYVYSSSLTQGMSPRELLFFIMGSIVVYGIFYIIRHNKKL